MSQQRESNLSVLTVIFILIVIANIGVASLIVTASTAKASMQNAECTPNSSDGCMIAVLYVVYPHWEPVAAEQISDDTEFTKFYDVAVCGTELFAGANSGLFSLAQDAEQWQQIQKPFPTGDIVPGIAFRDDQCAEVYAAVRNQGLWRGRLEDEEWDWEQIDDKSIEDDGAWDVVIQEDKLFYSGDFGIRWVELAEADEPLEWQETNVETLVVSVTENDGVLLAAVWNDNVYEKRASSVDWLEIHREPPDTLIYEAAANTQVTVAGTQEGILFAPFTLNPEWSVVTAVPPQTAFAAISFEDELYVGRRDATVYVTEDGQTWRSLPPFPDLRPDGEQGFQVRGFDIGLTDNRLYAATTSGVWRLVEVESTPPESEER